MERHELKRLWGHDFRVVPDGLAESDVALFVERLMSQYRASLEKSQHLLPLHELARKTVREAERLADEINEQAVEESRRRSGGIISQAEHAAREINERAVRAADAIEDEARKKVHEQMVDLEATFFTMKKWAADEFQALRELDERTHVLILS